MKPGRGGGLVGGNGNPPPVNIPLKNENMNINAPEGKRRSERVKREKPNFYDALEYDNQMRKVRKNMFSYIFKKTQLI